MKGLITMQPIQRNSWWQPAFWMALLGLANAHGIRPHSEGKHRKGTTKPKNWYEKRRIRRKMAAASRKINRGK
jgi:hypothetical protein